MRYFFLYVLILSLMKNIQADFPVEICSDLGQLAVPSLVRMEDIFTNGFCAPVDTYQYGSEKCGMSEEDCEGDAGCTWIRQSIDQRAFRGIPTYPARPPYSREGKYKNPETERYHLDRIRKWWEYEGCNRMLNDFNMCRDKACTDDGAKYLEDDRHRDISKIGIAFGYGNAIDKSITIGTKTITGIGIGPSADFNVNVGGVITAGFFAYRPYKCTHNSDCPNEWKCGHEITLEMNTEYALGAEMSVGAGLPLTIGSTWSFEFSVYAGILTDAYPDPVYASEYGNGWMGSSYGSVSGTIAEAEYIGGIATVGGMIFAAQAWSYPMGHQPTKRWDRARPKTSDEMSETGCQGARRYYHHQCWDGFTTVNPVTTVLSPAANGASLGLFDKPWYKEFTCGTGYSGGIDFTGIDAGVGVSAGIVNGYWDGWAWELSNMQKIPVKIMLQSCTDPQWTTKTQCEAKNNIWSESSVCKSSANKDGKTLLLTKEDCEHAQTGGACSDPNKKNRDTCVASCDNPDFTSAQECKGYCFCNDPTASCVNNRRTSSPTKTICDMGSTVLADDEWFEVTWTARTWLPNKWTISSNYIMDTSKWIEGQVLKHDDLFERLHWKHCAHTWVCTDKLCTNEFTHQQSVRQPHEVGLLPSKGQYISATTDYAVANYVEANDDTECYSPITSLTNCQQAVNVFYTDPKPVQRKVDPDMPLGCSTSVKDEKALYYFNTAPKGKPCGTNGACICGIRCQGNMEDFDSAGPLKTNSEKSVVFTLDTKVFCRYRDPLSQNSFNQPPYTSYDSSGTDSNIALGSCNNCAKGKYQHDTYPLLCMDCPVGKYQPNTGQIGVATCKTCPDGKYQILAGQTECKKVLSDWVTVDTAGTYTNNQSEIFTIVPLPTNIVKVDPTIGVEAVCTTGKTWYDTGCQHCNGHILTRFASKTWPFTSTDADITGAPFHHKRDFDIEKWLNFITMDVELRQRLVYLHSKSNLGYKLLAHYGVYNNAWVGLKLETDCISCAPGWYYNDDNNVCEEKFTNGKTTGIIVSRNKWEPRWPNDVSEIGVPETAFIGNRMVIPSQYDNAQQDSGFYTGYVHNDWMDPGQFILEHRVLNDGATQQCQGASEFKELEYTPRSRTEQYFTQISISQYLKADGLYPSEFVNIDQIDQNQRKIITSLGLSVNLYEKVDYKTAYCLECQPGYYMDASTVNDLNKQCVKCPVGKYNYDFGQLGCRECIGSFGDAANSYTDSKYENRLSPFKFTKTEYIDSLRGNRNIMETRPSTEYQTNSEMHIFDQQLLDQGYVGHCHTCDIGYQMVKRSLNDSWDGWDGKTDYIKNTTNTRTYVYLKEGSCLDLPLGDYITSTTECITAIANLSAAGANVQPGTVTEIIPDSTHRMADYPPYCVVEKTNLTPDRKYAVRWLHQRYMINHAGGNNPTTPAIKKKPTGHKRCHENRMCICRYVPDATVTYDFERAPVTASVLEIDPKFGSAPYFTDEYTGRALIDTNVPDNERIIDRITASASDRAYYNPYTSYLPSDLLDKQWVISPYYNAHGARYVNFNQISTWSNKQQTDGVNGNTNWWNGKGITIPLMLQTEDDSPFDHKTNEFIEGQCMHCPTGWYVNAAISTATFAQETRLVQDCKACPPGTSFSHSENDWFDQWRCVDCQPGKYNNVNASETCTNCPAGFYQPLSQQTECLPCDEQFYQDDEGRTYCKQCAASEYRNYNTDGINDGPATLCQKCTGNLAQFKSISASVDPGTELWQNDDKIGTVIEIQSGLWQIELSGSTASISAAHTVPGYSLISIQQWQLVSDTFEDESGHSYSSQFFDLDNNGCAKACNIQATDIQATASPQSYAVPFSIDSLVESGKTIQSWIPSYVTANFDKMTRTNAVYTHQQDDDAVVMRIDINNRFERGQCMCAQSHRAAHFGYITDPNNATAIRYTKPYVVCNKCMPGFYMNAPNIKVERNVKPDYFNDLGDINIDINIDIDDFSKDSVMCNRQCDKENPVWNSLSRECEACDGFATQMTVISSFRTTKSYHHQYTFKVTGGQTRTAGKGLGWNDLKEGWQVYWTFNGVTKQLAGIGYSEWDSTDRAFLPGFAYGQITKAPAATYRNCTADVTDSTVSERPGHYWCADEEFTVQFDNELNITGTNNIHNIRLDDDDAFINITELKPREGGPITNAEDCKEYYNTKDWLGEKNITGIQDMPGCTADSTGARFNRLAGEGFDADTEEDLKDRLVAMGLFKSTPQKRVFSVQKPRYDYTLEKYTIGFDDVTFNSTDTATVQNTCTIRVDASDGNWFFYSAERIPYDNDKYPKFASKYIKLPISERLLGAKLEIDWGTPPPSQQEHFDACPGWDCEHLGDTCTGATNYTCCSTGYKTCNDGTCWHLDSQLNEAGKCYDWRNRTDFSHVKKVVSKEYTISTIRNDGDYQYIELNDCTNEYEEYKPLGYWNDPNEEGYNSDYDKWTVVHSNPIRLFRLEIARDLSWGCSVNVDAAFFGVTESIYAALNYDGTLNIINIRSEDEQDVINVYSDRTTGKTILTAADEEWNVSAETLRKAIDADVRFEGDLYVTGEQQLGEFTSFNTGADKIRLNGADIGKITPAQRETYVENVVYNIEITDAQYENGCNYPFSGYEFVGPVADVPSGWQKTIDCGNYYLWSELNQTRTNDKWKLLQPTDGKARHVSDIAREFWPVQYECKNGNMDITILGDPTLLSDNPQRYDGNGVCIQAEKKCQIPKEDIIDTDQTQPPPSGRGLSGRGLSGKHVLLPYGRNKFYVCKNNYVAAWGNKYSSQTSIEIGCGTSGKEITTGRPSYGVARCVLDPFEPYYYTSMALSGVYAYNGAVGHNLCSGLKNSADDYRYYCVKKNNKHYLRRHKNLTLQVDVNNVIVDQSCPAGKFWSTSWDIGCANRPCATNPCDNGATCVDGEDSYTCACVAGYSGKNCTTDIDECTSVPCQNGGICTDHVNSFSCACVKGFTGANCTECGIGKGKNLTGHCENCMHPNYSSVTTHNAACVAENCPDGQGVTPDNATWTATGGCELCGTGYESPTGSGQCTDINDCATNPCDNGGTCTDGENSYTCACVAGYSGKNCTTNINECSPDPCQNGATCVDGVNSYTCICTTGYSGETCNNHTCEGFVCPKSFTLRTSPGNIICSTNQCTVDDLYKCCSSTTPPYNLNDNEIQTLETIQDCNMCTPTCTYPNETVRTMCKCVKDQYFKSDTFILAKVGDYCDKDGFFDPVESNLMRQSNVTRDRERFGFAENCDKRCQSAYVANVANEPKRNLRARSLSLWNGVYLRNVASSVVSSCYPEEMLEQSSKKGFECYGCKQCKDDTESVNYGPKMVVQVDHSTPPNHGACQRWCQDGIEGDYGNSDTATKLYNNRFCGGHDKNGYHRAAGRFSSTTQGCFTETTRTNFICSHWRRCTGCKKCIDAAANTDDFPLGFGPAEPIDIYGDNSRIGGECRFFCKSRFYFERTAYYDKWNDGTDGGPNGTAFTAGNTTSNGLFGVNKTTAPSHICSWGTCSGCRACREWSAANDTSFVPGTNERYSDRFGVNDGFRFREPIEDFSGDKNSRKVKNRLGACHRECEEKFTSTTNKTGLCALDLCDGCDTCLRATFYKTKFEKDDKKKSMYEDIESALTPTAKETAGLVWRRVPGKCVGFPKCFAFEGVCETRYCKNCAECSDVTSSSEYDLQKPIYRE